jgi:NAD(P)-dependent dehydrogenase (short-subunit alcohol dehydrogenase family)/hemerythrin superfamily protein
VSTEARPVAVVTGASAGVGRATALAFAVHGFDVALLARGAEGTAAGARDVEAAGGRALSLTVDVSVFDQVHAAARQVEEELGPIDVWVNDAMTTVFSPLADTNPEDFRRAVEVTFLGQVWGTKVALERMRPRDRGAIVNVGSALAFIGIPLQSAYCASKFACRGFFETIRAELLHDRSHITMSMVHLPAVNTPQFEWCKTTFTRHPQPVGPIYQPEVCAQAILDAALTGRRERVLGSWNKLLVSAARAAPGLGNQFAARGAWDEQLADRPLQPDRPVNLYTPADAEVDYGAHGTFDDVANGVFEPSFLVTLPKAAREFGSSLVANWSERIRVMHIRGQSGGAPIFAWRPGGVRRLIAAETGTNRVFWKHQPRHRKGVANVATIETRDIVDLLAADHHLVEEQFIVLDAAAAADRDSLFCELVHMLVRHEVAEELVVYPAIVHDAPEGEAVANPRLKEQADAEQTLADMEKIDSASPEFGVQLAQLKSAVLAHATSEEETIFPILRQVEDSTERAEMAARYQRAKDRAPTHPHPHASDTPPGNKLLGPVATLFDKARDAVKSA